MFSWKMRTAVAEAPLQTQLVGLNKRPFRKTQEGKY